VDNSYAEFFANCQQRCQSVLPEMLGDAVSEPALSPPALQQLFTASSYSLSLGGKRIRPIMVYAAADAITPQANIDAIDHVACAIEMIHTYSLIHDDLPAMDDDDLRRGRASCHKAFDEATAILAGDALHSRAFELLAIAPGLSAEQRVKMIEILAAAAGPIGMVGGQSIDIGATGSEINLSQLQTMHEMKTGALIRAALALGGITSGASHVQLTALDDYGRHIGLAFQVADDILDVESDSATLGKTQGKDAEANKPTYVKLMGLEGAKSEAQRLLAEALSSLNCFSESADHLRDLARYIIERKN